MSDMFDVDDKAARPRSCMRVRESGRLHANAGHYESCSNESGAAGQLGLLTVGVSIELDDLYAGARACAATVTSLLTGDVR